MNRRVVAGLVFLGAGLLYAGVTVPLQRRAAEASDEYRRTRDQRREAQSRLVRLERRETVRARAAGMLAAAFTGQGDPVSWLRRSVVASLKDVPVTGVRLAVRTGRSPVAAGVQVSAEGSFADVVRLSGRLVRPESGVVLQRVRFSPAGSGLALDLEGLSLGGKR